MITYLTIGFLVWCYGLVQNFFDEEKMELQPCLLMFFVIVPFWLFLVLFWFIEYLRKR